MPKVIQPFATVTVTTSSLITLEAMLERIHTAATEGGLEWSECNLTAELTFEADVDEAAFDPLEALVEGQNRIHGVQCSLKLPSLSSSK
jgi:hypothetical protein